DGRTTHGTANGFDLNGQRWSGADDQPAFGDAGAQERRYGGWPGRAGSGAGGGVLGRIRSRDPGGEAGRPRSGRGGGRGPGAQFGLGMLWTVPISLPLAATVEEPAGRLGLAGKEGLAALIKENFPRPVLSAVAILLAAANAFKSPAERTFLDKLDMHMYDTF